MQSHAFEMAVPDTNRNFEKPRQDGLTMMMDVGMPLGMQRDWLGLIGPYVDMAKLVTGTAALYPTDYLREKLKLYREHQVKPFIGGISLKTSLPKKVLMAQKHFLRNAARWGSKRLRSLIRLFRSALKIA